HRRRLLLGCRDPLEQLLLRQHLGLATFHGSKKLFAMDIAVLVPPFRFFRLGSELRHYAFGFVHLVLSRKAFVSGTLAGNAVTARNLPFRTVNTTDSKRPPLVRPTE